MRRALILFTLGILVAGIASSVQVADKEQRLTGAVATVEATARTLTVTEDLQVQGEAVRFLVSPRMPSSAFTVCGASSSSSSRQTS